ncbi:unnamed protein product [Lymnaea stagnalis]|uniref:Dynein light chain n=1 Tax=Lymnaea stagnalis TaxID=6523 RepID=A0AAV2HLM5_LYMST
MADYIPVVKSDDMPAPMRDEALTCAKSAIKLYSVERDIAAYIKKEFDKNHNPTWHCIVGHDFGSTVSHDSKNFIYFFVGELAILLFKSG